MGRYELLNVLGGGGFATVWRARTVGPGGFERAVAIKVMRPGRASQKRFQDMLLDEARLVARIQHPNVAQIWEVGEDPRSLYLAMELVDGESLDELRYRAEAAGKALPVRAVLRVLADVCGGLHVAHELAQDGAPLGLVHRDVSPQNILVSRHGIAKLIDFGIAKARERLSGDTTTGFIKGKISFMAPEQGRAEALDRRADIWAIGAVAYDLLEGRPPFEAETDVARLAALVGPAPAPTLGDRVPAPVRAVIERTLQKDPAARYPTALALKEAIEEALIESEMETSAEDCAALLRPYFQPPAASGGAIEAAPAGADAPSVERAVSSTIEAAAAGADAPSVERAVSSTIEARPPSDTIRLPLRRARSWPLVAGGALVAASLGLWALVRAPAVTPSPAELASPASLPGAPSADAPAATPAPHAPPAPPAASTPAARASAAPGASAAAALAVSAAAVLAAPAPASASASASAPGTSAAAVLAPPASAGAAPAPRPTAASSAASDVQRPPSSSAAGRPAAAPPPARPTSKLPDDDAIE